MKKLIRAFFALAIVAGVVFSTGCATSEPEIPGQNRYSSMPQNLPQQWEGQGMLGGMAGYQ